MGQEMKLDLNVKFSEGLSPDTVLLSHQYPSNVKRRHKKVKHIGKDEFWTLTEEDIFKNRFARFRSSSCKSILSRPNGLQVNVEMRRGSMYQSSKEVKYMKEMSNGEGRKKIEISRSGDTSFSGSIVNSLCSSDDEDPRKKSSVMYKHSKKNSRSVSRPSACLESHSPDDFIEFCINSDVRDRFSTSAAERDPVNSNARNDRANGSLEKDAADTLVKSFSSKVEVFHLPSPSNNDCLSKADSNVQSTPIKKMFNSFTKSKSLTSPGSRKLETSEVKSTGMVNMTRSRTYQKSLLNDFSNTEKYSDIISEFINRDIQHAGIASSPVHLHGTLKFENKHGVPFFEFKVNCPEDFLVAKTRRVDNAFNWVCTFHSVDGRKKSSATGLGSHDSDRGSSMVAQMLVSSDLCSEFKDGAFENSTVTEFLLYDLANSRSSTSLQKDSHCDQDSKTVKPSQVGVGRETFKVDERTPAIKNKLQDKLLFGSVDFDDSKSYPWFCTELRPNLESAAIVLQIPFHKRESFRHMRKSRRSARGHHNPSDHSEIEKRRKSLHEIRGPEQVKVVIPKGNHGLPIDENQGPSCLLDRWRHGGGCDCGGWDMACPLILLGNPSIQFSEDRSLMENNQTLELFVQGAKESCPTFSMRVVEEGHYAVDFHAQLSTVQAFAICVAILHGTGTFQGAGRQKKQELSQCSSMKMLKDDDGVEFLIDSVTREEKTASKSPKANLRSYVLKPPFSPVARV
ncbi:hypothetical protein QN277_028278 [Acacia crassicarpa]|uniref:Uncharacterized protein n=1 Tax=Acacia crassicarpa TaxID=499986 RepID=A0AAE1MEZ3_9FABA|nr:hypothetical protein QN277_028278 [Acacia crassicarpa]